MSVFQEDTQIIKSWRKYFQDGSSNVSNIENEKLEKLENNPGHNYVTSELLYFIGSQRSNLQYVVYNKT